MAFIEFASSDVDARGSIIGEEHPANSNECVHFWYVIEGSGSVDLKVSERCRKTGDTYEYGLLDRSVNATDSDWRFAQVPVVNYYFNYRLVFDVVRRAGFTGYFGLDDITIDFGNSILLCTVFGGREIAKFWILECQNCLVEKIIFLFLFCFMNRCFLFYSNLWLQVWEFGSILRYI